MAENQADGRSTKKSLTASVLLLCIAPALCTGHLSGNMGVDHYVCMTPGPEGLEVMAALHFGEVPTAAISVLLDKNHNGTLDPEEYQDYTFRSSQVRSYAPEIRIVCTKGELVYPMILGLVGRDDGTEATTVYMANGENGQKTLRIRWMYSAPWPNDILQRAAEPFDLQLTTRMSVGRFECQITTGLPRSPVMILSASVPTDRECPLPADNVPAVDAAKLVMTTEGKMRLVLAPGTGSEESGVPKAKVAAVNNRVAAKVSERIEAVSRKEKPARISEMEKIIKARLDALFQPPIGVFTRLIAVFLCFAWGMLHAFTPGHGKVIVSTYLIGSRATYAQAAILGILVMVAHTAVVLVLALASVLLKDRFVYPMWLQPLGAVIIMLVGVNQVRMVLTQWLHGGHGHLHEHHHDHAHNPHKHWGIFSHSHDHHPPKDRLASRDLAAIGLSGGMIPCPAAIVLLLLSWQLAVPVLGLVCLMSFSIGLAGTLMLVGFLSISGVQWVVRWRAKGDDDRRRATVLNIIPVIGGIVLILYGAVIMLSFR